MTNFLLPKSITINTIESLFINLKQIDKSESPVVLDASAIEIITTLGVQLLVVLDKTLRQTGMTLKLEGQTAALLQTLEQLGLKGLCV